MSLVVRSKQDLIQIFKELGLPNASEVMVHSSLKSLGFVVNGAIDVIDALRYVIGENGTLLMPAHSGDLSDPLNWESVDFDYEARLKIRNNLNSFNTSLTKIRNRGIISSELKNYPGYLRSKHPLNSVGALGLNAEYFTSEHELEASEGLNSPIGKLYQRNGWILLIGVNMTKCSAIHLAEYMADLDYLKDTKMTVLAGKVDGKNLWVKLKKYPDKSDCFDRIEHDFDSMLFKSLRLESGKLTLFRLRPIIDLVLEKLSENPNYLRGSK